MMQILEPFNGLKVLDLFAGIGTLGIEALSRGAKSATFVELKTANFRFLKQNINNICNNDKVILKNLDAFTFLKNTKEKYDLVLADPPYNQIDCTKLIMLIRDILCKNGRFAIEMKIKQLNINNIDIRKYGNTQVVFG